MTEPRFAGLVKEPAFLSMLTGRPEETIDYSAGSSLGEDGVATTHKFEWLRRLDLNQRANLVYLGGGEKCGEEKNKTGAGGQTCTILPQAMFFVDLAA